MEHRSATLPRVRALLLLVLCWCLDPAVFAEQPSPAATSAFNLYAKAVEARLARQHESAVAFLSPLSPEDRTRLDRGDLLFDRLSPVGGLPLPGALLHHWRGTAFVRGATPSDFERLMRSFDQYPRRFAPEVLQAQVLTHDGDHLHARMRIRQRHVITVVMDTSYDITFGTLDPDHGYSISRSTEITEIASPGTRSEHPLSPGEEHGFLWRLDTYWSYEERDGGLYLQIETISLTRSIPRGLGWAVQPYLESIPRDSLEFTLRSTCNALRS